MINLKIKASHDVTICPENMWHTIIECRMDEDDFADVISSLSSEQQRMVLDALDEAVVDDGIIKRKEEKMNIEEAADKYATNLYLQDNATPTRKQIDDYLAYKKGFTQGASWHHEMMWGGNSDKPTEEVTEFAKIFAKISYPLDAYSTHNIFPQHVACRVGFANGAKWQRNHVWHDPEEMPKQGKTLLAQTKHGPYIFGPSNEYWKETSIEMSVIRWAYTDDLLPEGGEE